MSSDPSPQKNRFKGNIIQLKPDLHFSDLGPVKVSMHNGIVEVVHWKHFIYLYEKAYSRCNAIRHYILSYSR
jgi:hypothetical protein